MRTIRDASARSGWRWRPALLVVLIGTAAIAATAIAAGSADVRPARTSTNVRSARTYLGTVERSASSHLNGGPRNPISVGVAANGRQATVIAIYNHCPELGIYYGERQFPTARIVEDGFSTTFSDVEKSAKLFARITVTGRFLAGGRVAGTISSATNIGFRPGLPAPVCRTSNPWSAVVQARGFRVCAPHPLGIFGVAQRILDERTPCRRVERALRTGRFTPAPPPLRRDAAFTTPGWTCLNHRTATPSWRCVSGHESFRFVVFS